MAKPVPPANIGHVFALIVAAATQMRRPRSRCGLDRPAKLLAADELKLLEKKLIQHRLRRPRQRNAEGFEHLARPAVESALHASAAGIEHMPARCSVGSVVIGCYVNPLAQLVHHQFRWSGFDDLTAKYLI